MTSSSTYSLRWLKEIETSKLYVEIMEKLSIYWEKL